MVDIMTTMMIMNVTTALLHQFSNETDSVDHPHAAGPSYVYTGTVNIQLLRVPLCLYRQQFIYIPSLRKK